MTDEEYLRARGWKESIGAWSRHWSPDDEWMSLAEAVEAQLAEDRAVLAFVLARSDMTLHTTAPSDDPMSPFRQKVTIDVDKVDLDPKR